METKEDKYYRNWKRWLINYGGTKDIKFDINIYNQDIIRELYSNGISIPKAYKQLLSELPNKSLK